MLPKQTFCRCPVIMEMLQLSAVSDKDEVMGDARPVSAAQSGMEESHSLMTGSQKLHYVTVSCEATRNRDKELSVDSVGLTTGSGTKCRQCGSVRMSIHYVPPQILTALASGHFTEHVNLGRLLNTFALQQAMTMTIRMELDESLTLPSLPQGCRLHQNTSVVSKHQVWRCSHLLVSLRVQDP